MTCMCYLAGGVAYSDNKIKAAVSKAVEHTGYSSLTEEQYEAVSNFVAGQDVFVSLPTGVGKSLCYLVLPVVFDYLRSPSAAAAPLGKSILVVVSPLKCLMEDQVARFSSCGVRSTYICKEKCKQSVLGQDGQYQIV